MERFLRITGRSANGTRVGAAALRGLLDLYLQGARLALRLRTEGRSSAKGPLPAWIDAAVEADIQLQDGSTRVQIDAPALLDAVPEQFRQTSLFPELDASLSAFDYVVESLCAAVDEEGDPSLYDRSLLKFFRSHERLFSSAGVDTLDFENEQGATILSLGRGSFSGLRDLERRIPPPQQIRLAGKLDAIRHSDLTFSLVVGTSRIRGIADESSAAELKNLWGHHVVIGGEAYFTLKGDIQRIEAVHFTPATPTDLELWETLPEPLDAGSASLREPQGPRSGLNAIFGKWPGDETDEDVAVALDAMS